MDTGLHVRVPLDTESSKPDHRGRAGLFARLRDEQGSILIETALSFTVLVAMLLGLIDVCMLGYSYSVLAESAREGVRYAIVHGTDSSVCSGPSLGCSDAVAANVKLAVTNYASTFAGNLSGVVVNVTYPDSLSTANSRVQVSITYTYQPLFFHVGGFSPVLTTSSAGRILY